MIYSEIEIGMQVIAVSRGNWAATVTGKFIGAGGVEYVELTDSDGRWGLNYPHQLAPAGSGVDTA
jgi:hypothetical protein